MTTVARRLFALGIETRRFVFISGTHGNPKIDMFLVCLLSRPAFNEHVTDIVAEWASSAPRRQRLLDRYLLVLDAMASDSLAPVLLDTDTPTLWRMLPNLRTFLEALRAVNGTLQPAKRIRLLAGNEGIQWEKVRTAADLEPFPFKTNYMAHLLIDHLAKMPGRPTARDLWRRARSSQHRQFYPGCRRRADAPGVVRGRHDARLETGRTGVRRQDWESVGAALRNRRPARCQDRCNSGRRSDPESRRTTSRACCTWDRNQTETLRAGCR